MTYIEDNEKWLKSTLKPEAEFSFAAKGHYSNSVFGAAADRYIFTEFDALRKNGVLEHAVVETRLSQKWGSKMDPKG